MGGYRILSLDGGVGRQLPQVLWGIAQGIEAVEGQRFLDHVDLFAGVSAGGINALFLAKYDDPTRALQEITSFWSKIEFDVLKGLGAQSLASLDAAAAVSHMLTATMGLGGTLTGQRPLHLNHQLRDVLIHHFGRHTTLRDLKQNVVIVSFALDAVVDPHLGLAGVNALPVRTWKPKIFNNLDRDGESDLDELVVDVALRSCACPIELPVYQGLAGLGPGYVDGGVVANNPAMIALTAILGQWHQQGPADEPHGRAFALSDMLLLSIGSPRNLIANTQNLVPQFTNGAADWGYSQWLFDFNHPLALVDLMLQGSTLAIAYQCKQLLGRHFFRLHTPATPHQLPPTHAATSNPIYTPLLQAAGRWLYASGWLEPRTTEQPLSGEPGERTP